MHKSERIFADYLTEQGREWEYHPTRFKVGEHFYHPDFYLPKENLYIEVVGTRQAYHHNKDKILKFKADYPNINFEILDYLGNPYPTKYPIKRKKSTKEKSPKARYQISLALNEEDYKVMQERLKAGYKQIELFRLGMALTKEADKDNKMIATGKKILKGG